tara:strand:- start:245 stop:1066 length:822 start_codon:yes stop_codon:yes gene_type:complete
MRDNEDRFPPPPPIPQSGANNLNFVIPTELVELPSKGRFYPPDHPLHGAEFVEIKHMTAKEEDILTSTNLIEKGVVLDYLVQSLLIDKTINAKTLLSGDQNAILLNARINGYGTEYTFQVPCAECQGDITVEHDLETIGNKNPDYDDCMSNGLIELSLPKSKVRIKFRYLNLHEHALLTKEVEKSKNLGTGHGSVTTFLRYIIQSVNDRSFNNSPDIFSFIQNIPSYDVKAIQKAYLDFLPDVDFSCDIECNSCGHVERRQVPITAQFFWPQS